MDLFEIQERQQAQILNLSEQLQETVRLLHRSVQTMEAMDKDIGTLQLRTLELQSAITKLRGGIQ